MKVERACVALLLAAGLVVLPACADDNPDDTLGEFTKGGDDRTGEYDPVVDWWKPAADHDDEWTWGEVSGVAVDNPNRIVVSVWGDRSRDGRERPGGSNYMVVVDGDGNMIDNWSQWDSLFNKAHQTYISPYDPERHVWLTEMGGGRGVNHQILKFTNDGGELVMRLVDPDHPRSREEARAKPNPGPYAYGNPAVLAFLPDGSFLLGDGYWNSRIIKYDPDGEYVWEFGELGSGPGQFDLIHGLAVGRGGRIHVADRSNNRIQVFTEDGEFIEEWPDVTDPVGVYIDENESVWVNSARLNRILKYSRDGELLYHFGVYGGTRGGFPGGLARPHQIDVDENGTLYVTSWDGGWVNKFVPKPGADPSKLVGKRLILTE